MFDQYPRAQYLCFKEHVYLPDELVGIVVVKLPLAYAVAVSVLRSHFAANLLQGFQHCSYKDEKEGTT